jgi:hypothetical protein
MSAVIKVIPIYPISVGYRTNCFLRGRVPLEEKFSSLDKGVVDPPELS